MLLRGITGQKGGDGTGCGRRKDGCYASPQSSIQVNGFLMRPEIGITKPINDPKYNLSMACHLIRGKLPQSGIGVPHSPEALLERGHEIDDAAAAVIGEVHDHILRFLQSPGHTR